jgi:hypothetical protein
MVNTTSGSPAVSDGKRTAAFLGFLPVMVTMPLVYWPRWLESDTQIWVSMGALISCFVFWPRSDRAGLTRLYLPVIAALCCLAIYLLTETDQQVNIRYAGIMVTFSLLWIIACRGGQEFVGTAIRLTIVIWFVVGFYQLIAIRLGLPVEFFGRYVAGRSGVPSLTAEPSFFGSISVLHLMYLLGENKPKNRFYICISVLNVLLSGSILSYVFLVIPLFRLDYKYILAGILVLFLFTTQGVRLSESGMFSRISNIGVVSVFSDPMKIVRSDASTNFRVGHAIFTLYENLDESILMKNTSSFREEYNSWAFRQGGYMYNSSDFILVSGGELLFFCGPFGLMLILSLMFIGTREFSSNKRKFEKIAFMSLCLLSPISFSNPFFVFYLAQRARDVTP